MPDNDTAIDTGFLTSRENSLTQGNSRDSNSLVLSILGTEHMKVSLKVSLGPLPCSVGELSCCSQPEKVISLQYMSDSIILSPTSNFT